MRKFGMIVLVLMLILSAAVFTACEKDEDGKVIKITFDLDGGLGTADITKVFGEAIEAPTPPTKAGYTFKGWFANEELTTPFTFATMPEQAITVYAKWEANKYTVTFDSREGSEVGSITADYASIINAPQAPTRAGYTFDGWFTSTESDAPQYVFNVMPAQNINLYAKWTILSFTYTFFDEDGTTELKKVTASYGSEIVPPTDHPTKAADAQYTYTFNAWDKTIPATLTENVTFTASYSQTVNGYTYIFYDEDGTTELKKVTASYGSEIVPPTDHPTKAADAQYTYTFNVWDKTIPATLTENVTFTAEYSSTAQSYTIIYDSKGGTSVNSATVSYGATINAPSAPTKEYFSFVAWFIQGTDEQFAFTTMPANDVNLYAKWAMLEGYCEVVVIGGSGSGIYLENTLIGIGDAEIPQGMYLDKWKINGIDYTTYSNFYYFLDQNILVEAVFASYDSLPPAAPIGESPLAAFDGIAENYPLHKSRIVAGYSQLYFSQDLEYILAVYPDGTLIIELYDASEDDDDDSLCVIWGTLEGDNCFISGSAEFYGEETWIDEENPNFFHRHFGNFIVLNENLIITDGDFVAVNAKYFVEPLPDEEEGIEISRTFLGDAIYCPMDESIDYIERDLLEVIASVSLYEGEDSCYMTENLWLNIEIQCLDYTEVEGFDSSQAGEGIITVSGYQIPIIYYDMDQDPIVDFELFGDNDASMYFIQGDTFDGEYFYDYGFYMDNNTLNDNLITSYITEDMLTGFSTAETGKFQMEIRCENRLFFVTYYVIAEDAPGKQVIDIGYGEIIIDSEGNYLDVYIEILLASEDYGLISNDPEDLVNYQDALASGDLVLNISSLATGWQEVEITYLGVSGTIEVFYHDLNNPQFTIFHDHDFNLYNDNIYIHTDGTVTLTENLSTTFEFDNGISFRGIPPIEYFIGLDLSIIGRQAIKLYPQYGHSLTLYVVVYEGGIPPKGYSIDFPEYIAKGAAPAGEIYYYAYRDYSESDDTMYIDAITEADIEGLSTDVLGWQLITIRLERMDLFVEMWVYVYSSEEEAIGHEVYSYPLYALDTDTDTDILSKIRVETTYLNGSKAIVYASEIDRNHIQLVISNSTVYIEFAEICLVNPESPFLFGPFIQLTLISQASIDNMFSFQYDSSADAYKITAVSYVIDSLTEVTLPSEFNGPQGVKPVFSVDSLPPNFSVKKLIIPASITNLARGAFNNFVALKEVVFLSTEPPTHTKDNAFNGPRNIIFFVPDSSKDAYIAAMAETFSQRILGISERNDYVVKDGVLLAYLGSDRDIVIPNNVSALAAEIFHGDKNIRSVYFPSSVTAIPTKAFFQASNLTSVIFEENSALVSIGSQAFYYCEALVSITLPSSLKRIEDTAFAYCKNLYLAALPSGIEYIGGSAFFSTKLYDPNSYNSLVYIDNWLIVANIYIVEIKEGTVGIATYGCFGGYINYVVVSESVKWICNAAFGSNITVTFLSETPPSFHIHAFDSSNVTIYVPKGTLAAYQSAIGRELNIQEIA